MIGSAKFLKIPKYTKTKHVKNKKHAKQETKTPDYLRFRLDIRHDSVNEG